jgi:dCMP deaminase
MFLPWFPCMDCARAIVQVGISDLIALRPDFSDPVWGEDFRYAIELFDEAGVRVHWVDADPDITPSEGEDENGAERR